MKSTLPKVLHEVGGKPMLEWVIDAARRAGCAEILVVVGHGGEQIRESMGSADLSFVTQRRQLGTGHALAQIEDHVREEATLLVLSGDVPLVSAPTLEALLDAAVDSWGAMAVADLDEPGSLGRVLSSSEGRLDRIVEAADADEATLDVHLVNAGVYAFSAPEIFDYLRRLEPDNAKGELYLTDALGIAVRDGKTVSLVELEDPSEAFGVNNRLDLAQVHRELQMRTARRLMLEGVTILDPGSTFLDADVAVGADSVIHPGNSLLGATRVGPNCVLGQGCWIRNSTVSENSVIEPYSVVDGAEIGPECRVGPFARLRPGTVLVGRAKVGNFVETKNSRLQAGVKAGHLAYIGDAEVGENANIGAGSITCNYDGKKKHRTEIGRGAFIGSDTMLVAPVKIGDGAMTAAGSVISKDVPSDSLAIERSSQKHLIGWMTRFKKRGSE